MSRYKAYPEYRDSGVAWLGKIPLSWSAVSIKRQALIFNGATPKSEVTDFWDGDISWITPADLGRDKSPYIMSGARSITQAGYSSCGTTLVPRGSVILSSRAPIGTLGIAAQELCTNQGCKSLVTGERLDSEYLFYVLLSSTTQLNLLGRGTTFLELSADELGLYKISFPPPADQRTIAAFLDHETAKIDALIEKQQRLIELLKEKRQAVISHAVTKGLNPNVLMKDSGVEWLGNIPKEWEALCFGRLIIKAELGENYDSAEGNEGTPVLKMGNLDRGFVKLEKLECLPAEIKISESAVLKNGDFLFNTRNSLDLVGKVSIWRGELPKATFNSNILRIDFNSLLVETTSYMNYFFNSDLGLSQLRVLAKGTTSVAAIYWKDLTSLRVLLPPPAEQHAIVSHLNSACDRLDELTSKAQRAIALLQESRTALISAAVTGKIDVRDWQAAA